MKIKKFWQPSAYTSINRGFSHRGPKRNTHLPGPLLFTLPGRELSPDSQYSSAFWSKIIILHQVKPQLMPQVW